jgi:hypothetical protein
MARWRQSTRGGGSPAVGGDYIKDSFHTSNTHLSTGLSELIGDNYKLRHEVESLGRRAWEDGDLLHRSESRMLRWRLAAIVLAVLLAATAFAWRLRPEQPNPVSQPAPIATDSQQAVVSPDLEAARPTTDPTFTPAPIPVVIQSAPECTPGKWITVVDSSTSGKPVSELIRYAADITERSGGSLDLKFGATDAGCTTLGRNVIVLYTGPVDSAAAAARVCQELGWRTASQHDHDRCYGKALDRSLPKQTVLPDGSLTN